ncbi:MAG: ABC transporter substrate-binding protein [Acidimicrobiales bacterium]|nr:ABC transporter substrate-binding protein [Acidimicrobiales bacterium]
MTRPSRLRLFAALTVVLALVLAACSSGSSDSSSEGTGGGSEDTTLDVAFVADMQVPDPDIFYEIEGNLVVTSVYEGLVRYKPSSPEIEPALADSWTVSPDGLTYTFNLKPDVKFASGAPADAQAWVESFQRRLDVNAAPAYMLADVVSTAAPDPTTFVVTLANPVNPFLDYLAAAYGPKAVDPTVLAAEGGDDFAQSYLATNSAGTGPYQISEFNVGTGYQLTLNPNYWGPKPYFETVNISIIPDIATQRLKLESGELDMMTHGLPVADVESFRENPDFQVQTFPVLIKTMLSANPDQGPFADEAVRKGLQQAFDKEALTEEIYATQAEPSTQVYPATVLPPTLALDVDTYDPEALTTAVAALPADQRSVDMAYSEDEGGTIGRLAETVATTLEQAGLDVTVRGLPIGQVLELPTAESGRPDLLLFSFNPDAAHPDTWARIFYFTGGGLNFLGCSVPAADALMDQGLVQLETAPMQQFYGQAGDEIVDSGCYTTIADNLEVVVARTGITGFVHQIATPYTVRLKDLTAG